MTPAAATVVPHPVVMEVDDERSDPELVEIFIEEAKEEVANIRRHLPAWQQDRDNSEALIAARRSFHTLKGSGRMIGAQVIGEFAWNVENLLNRIINHTLSPSDEAVEFLSRATEFLPQLIEQLEIGTQPADDADLFIEQAHAYAEGDVDVELRNIAAANQATPDQVKKHYEENNLLDDLRWSIRERKVRDFLRDSAKITDK